MKFVIHNVDTILEQNSGYTGHNTNPSCHPTPLQGTILTKTNQSTYIIPPPYLKTQHGYDHKCVFVSVQTGLNGLS